MITIYISLPMAVSLFHDSTDSTAARPSIDPWTRVQGSSIVWIFKKYWKQSISRITRITRIHPCRHNCHGWPSAGEKSLKLINTPSHSPNDGQASPCLKSHSTHIPILIACSILCLVLPYHSPIHAPQSMDY